MIEFMISHSYLGDGCLLRNDTHYDTFPQSGNISVKRVVTFPNRVTKHYLIEEHVT